MEQITIGQIFGIFAVLAGAISSIGIIVGVIIKFWKWLNRKEMNPVLDEIAKMEKRIMDEMKSSDTAINEKMDSLKDDIKILDVNQCKDVITSYISALEQNNHIDAIFEERAYEAMDRYTNVLHQNSYIHKRWEEVVNKIKDTKE